MMVLIALGYSSNKQVLKLEKWLKMLLLHSCVWMKGSISCCCCLLVKAPLKSRTKAAELLTETWLYSIVYYFHNYGPHYHLVWIPDPHRYQQNSCTELMTLVQFHSFHVRNHARWWKHTAQCSKITEKVPTKNKILKVRFFCQVSNFVYK